MPFSSSINILACIQALPQELQSNILAHALQLPRKVLIDKSYSPPLALHLDHASRTRYSSEYYSKTIFECTTPKLSQLIASSTSLVVGGESALFLWLHSLHYNDLFNISKIQITETTASWDFLDVVYEVPHNAGKQVVDMIRRSIGPGSMWCQIFFRIRYKVLNEAGEVERPYLDIRCG